MVQIIESSLNLEFPLGHHLHCLVAQIPVRLRCVENLYTIEDPDRQWDLVRSVLDRVVSGAKLRNLHFLVFPESSVPASRFDDVLAHVHSRLRSNTVTVFGMEHVTLEAYRRLLYEYRDDNAEALALVEHDLEEGALPHIPVNWCCIAVKESTGKLRVFLEAKTHPFRGEEYLNKTDDLYRGRHFYFFRSTASYFTFMALICLDYIYRDVYSSNIRQVIDHANRLFLTTRQTLGALLVIQANPKPQHRAYWEVMSGFYGEYLEQTPGVRDSVTVLANCSDESSLDGEAHAGGFGSSSVVVGRHYKVPRVSDPEFCTDDFDGAPVCRLRFGTATRLYYFNLPADHFIDPRSTRVPMKVHLVMQRMPDGEWREEVSIPWPTAPSGTGGMRR